MKVKIAAALMVAVFLFPAIALAQDTTPGGKLQQKKDNQRMKVQDRKEDMKAQVATRAAELKSKLAKFKDQKKAAKAEMVSDNLNKINKNRTEHFLKFLDKATEILSRLEARVNEAGSKGRNTTQAKGAIAAAKAALVSARATVQVQATKDYTITVTSETKVKDDVKSVRDKLHTDLQAVKKQVVDAKGAVASAIRVAKSNIGDKNGTK